MMTTAISVQVSKVLGRRVRASKVWKYWIVPGWPLVLSVGCASTGVLDGMLMMVYGGGGDGEELPEKCII
jgi:hypothetical protein